MRNLVLGQASAKDYGLYFLKSNGCGIAAGLCITVAVKRYRELEAMKVPEKGEAEPLELVAHIGKRATTIASLGGQVCTAAWFAYRYVKLTEGWKAKRKGG